MPGLKGTYGVGYGGVDLEMVPNKEERMFVIECGNDGASTVVAKAQSRKKSVRAFVIECENDGSSTIVVGSPETKNEENEEDENDDRDDDSHGGGGFLNGSDDEDEAVDLLGSPNAKPKKSK